MKTFTSSPSTFTSTDLYLSAFLVAHGAPLLRSTRSNGRVHFTFAHEARCIELRGHFLNNGEVKVGDYRRCLQDLKTEIFSTS